MVREPLRDPLAGSPWSRPDMVSGFATSQPNLELMRVADLEFARGGRRLLDIGCGAGRNAIPLAERGWNVTATDLSAPMLVAAAARADAGGLSSRLHLALAPMERLPVRSASSDFVVAHGIWNLARSSTEFRGGVAEAARIAVPGAALFVFTFSRHTLPPTAQPVAGEAFVFTDFSGEPQCFVTEPQLLDELSRAGFTLDPAGTLREHNLPRPGILRTGSAPVIWEGVFRRQR